MSGRRNQAVARAGASSASATDILLLTIVAIVVVIGGGTWLTGQAAAGLFDGRWPSVSFTAALDAAVHLPAHWRDPRQAWPAGARAYLPGLPGFAVAAVLVLAAVAVAGTVAVRWRTRHQSQSGFASRARISRTLSERAVIRRGPVVRPSLAGTRIRVDQVGVRIARAVPSGLRLAASSEDSVELLAPPRVGKSSQVVIPWLRDWPGAAFSTSVRSDVLLATAIPRRRRGPVAVMAPTGMIGWPDRFTWDITSGCENFGKARSRADVMTVVGKGSSGGDSTNSGFFSMSATNLLAAWLHAAALSGGSMNDVLAWAFDERVDAPIRILASHPDAVTGTAAMLDSLYRQPAESTRASLWATAQTALAPLLAPAARAVFAPPGESSDLKEFLKAGGTCYLLASEREAADLAPAVAAFADELIETAKDIAETMPGGRLDPPLGLFLDEVANVVPLPKLPELMSFAGGSGIFVLAVLQSMAQARKRWGQESAEMLWGASTVKIVLGGLAGQDLEEISRLSGEYRETVVSWQNGLNGHSLSTSLQDRRTMTAEDIRTLDDMEREALVIRSTTPVVKARMTRHYEGPHRQEFAGSVRESRRIAGLDTDEDNAAPAQPASGPKEEEPPQEGEQP